MTLSEMQKQFLTERALRLESSTGVEVVVAVVARCDHYPEIPWKAFALAASLSAAGVAGAEWLRPDWIGLHHATLSMLTVLMAGALAALATLASPRFAKLFLDQHTVDAQAHQCAAAMFLNHQWFRTRERNCVLLLIAQFERRVVVMPDIGLATALSPDLLARVVNAMQAQLATGRMGAAIEAGFDALETLILERGLAKPKLADEVTEVLIEEKP